MSIEKQIISLAIAQRLAELGVKQESWCWWYQEVTPTNRNMHEYGVPQQDMKWRLSITCQPSCLSTSRVFKEYAAFTLAEAELMLPKEVNIAYKNGKPRDDSHWLKTQRVHQGYRVAYLNSRYDSNSWQEVRAQTFADACGLMLVHLIENNLMK